MGSSPSGPLPLHSAPMTLPEIVLALMLILQPPGRSIYSLVEVPEGSPPACDDATNLLCSAPVFDASRGAWVRPEARDEGIVRYWTIAQEIATVAEATTWQPTAECPKRPSVRVVGGFGDPKNACERAALERPWSGKPEELARYLVVVSFHESGWRRDVHSGIGKFSKGDHGKSWCLGQIMLGESGRAKTTRGFQARSIVGVEPEPTRRCLQTAADKLALSRAFCASPYGPGDVGPSCVTAVYGGSALLATSPIIRKRAITYRRLIDSWKTAQIPVEVRDALGLQPSQSSTAPQDGATLLQSRFHLTIPDACTFSQTSSQDSPFGVGCAAGHPSS
jgi:hypothetical protein